MLGHIIFFGMFFIVKSNRGGKRFSKVIEFKGDKIKANALIKTLLTVHKYLPTVYGEESGVYKYDEKDEKAMFCEKFIKVEEQEEGFLIEAFVKAYKKESSLKGVINSIYKGQVKDTVDKLAQFIIHNSQCTIADNDLGEEKAEVIDNQLSMFDN